MAWSPAQKEAIDRSRVLKKAGISTGRRQLHWVGYVLHGEPCREYYPTARQAFDRAAALAGVPGAQAVLRARQEGKRFAEMRHTYYPHDDAELLIDPKAGDLCWFKYETRWAEGVIAGDQSTEQRVPVYLAGGDTYVHWRNRSQIYRRMAR